MKKMIVLCCLFFAVPALAADTALNGFTNITESTLTASDEFVVWNSGGVKNITAENLWDWFVIHAHGTLAWGSGETAGTFVQTWNTGSGTDASLSISDLYFTFNKIIQCEGIETTRSEIVGGSIVIGYEGSNNGDSYVALKAPDARDTTLTLLYPTADPTAGQVLTAGAPSDGVSTLTWSTYVAPTSTQTLDFGGATLEIPNSDDPDVSVTGQISLDTDGWLRTTYDGGTTQRAIGRVQEEIHVTVYKPQDLDDAQRDHFWIWSNESGMNFVVTGWKGWSTSDDTSLTIYEEDVDGQNDATVDAVEIATNGTSLYYGSDTTITAPTIENGHLLYLDFDDTDTPAMVKLTIYGYYDANVN